MPGIQLSKREIVASFTLVGIEHEHLGKDRNCILVAVQNGETRSIFREGSGLRRNDRNRILKMNDGVRTVLASVFNDCEHCARSGIARTLRQYLKKQWLGRILAHLEFRLSCAFESGQIGWREFQGMPVCRQRLREIACSRGSHSTQGPDSRVIRPLCQCGLAQTQGLCEIAAAERLGDCGNFLLGSKRLRSTMEHAGNHRENRERTTENLTHD